MKVLVCGGRRYSDIPFLNLVLDKFHSENPITELVEGEAGVKNDKGEAILGADILAARWASDKPITVYRHPANWKKHERKAGGIRNSLMLKLHPDIETVIAFPGGSGTEDMVRKSLSKGIKVIEARKHYAREFDKMIEENRRH
jgi:hypothetical protein